MAKLTKPKLTQKHSAITGIVLIVMTGIVSAFLVYQKMQEPFRIDFSSLHDIKAEAYYTPKAEVLFNLESGKLGEPFTAFRTSRVEKLNNRCYFVNNSDRHERRHGCEISQTGFIPLGNPAEKQQFHDAVKRLNTTLEEQKWETKGTDAFDVDKGNELKLLPFASYVTTQPLPVTYHGITTSWPQTRYYKTSYYREIGHEASCSIDMFVDQTQPTATLRLGLDCTFDFDDRATLPGSGLSFHLPARPLRSLF